ncbi:MAG: hypothetical protein WCE52_16765, partial [Candidatus Acidiferrum sp.]
FCILIPQLASTPLIQGGSRMRRSARTDLCGGRSVMIVPTASLGNGLDNRTIPSYVLANMSVSALKTSLLGLLQLAYADQKRYGCDFNWQVDRELKANDPAKTILQPKNNLECGVKILVNQIIVQHKPLLTSSGYWSTLRPAGPSYLVFAK